jgi:hypothetical protein
VIRFHCYRAGIFHTFDSEPRMAHATLITLVAEGWVITKRETLAAAA